MRHIRPNTAIKLVAGELPDDARRDAERHIEQCPECHALVDATRDMHEALGEWQPAADDRDLWPAIESELDQARSISIRPATHRFAALLRVAAVIVAGAGIGYFVGLETRPSPSTQPSPIGDDALAAALSLDVLESPSATGLLAVFNNDEFEGDQP